MSDNARVDSDQRHFYGDPVGPLAMILCGLGQARKGAAAANDSCAEMWLMGLPPKPVYLQLLL